MDGHKSHPAPSPIYLDHNATTPVDPKVFAAMVPYFTEKFGNPSSVEHVHGNEAAAAVEHAREQVASLINAQPKEIIFTGSCTEANNLAIFGVARALPTKGEFITSQIEHPSVLEAFRHLESEGHKVIYLPVDENAQVDPNNVATAITNQTALVSIMAGNNEVGTLQPIREIGEICSARNVLFHSDLAQVTAYCSIDVARDHLHLASLSAHKAYGPKGIGALFTRLRKPRVKLAPILVGGGQERGLRPGTLNTPLIVGMGEAFVYVRKHAQSDADRLGTMCRRFRERLMQQVSGAYLNGHPSERIPNSLSFSIEGIEPLALIRLLNNVVSFSASSACATQEVKTSHVLLAMFGDTWRARNAFRIAPGRFTTEDEIERAFNAITDAANRLRRTLV